MRKRQAFIALALLSYILAGCYDAKDIKSGNHVPVINLDSAYVSDFNYSELFQSVRFIILDNTETLLANIDKMLLHKDTFLILDRKGQGVYAYRKDGTFIRKYGNHGPAPGEYVNCTDFTFSSKDAELYIYDRYRRKILTYDLHSGTFKRDISIQGDSPFDIICHSDQSLFAYQSQTLGKEKPHYMLHQIDLKSGKITAHLYDAEIYNKGWKDVLTNASQCLTPISTNETLFCAPLMDTVLSIKNGEVHPAFALKGKQIIQKEDIPEIYKNYDIQVRGRNIAQLIVSLYKSNKSFGFSQFFIHKDILYFQCNRSVGSRLQYNLRNGQVRQSKKIHNDILFTKNVSLNRTLPGFLGADSTGVYYCYRNEQLSELKIFLQEGYLSDKVENKELLKLTNEDTNPILCYYVFKTK